MVALGEQQVRPGRPLAEQHQDGALPRLLVLGRHEPGQVVDRDRPGGVLDRPQPVGKVGGQRSTPRCSRTRSTISFSESRPPNSTYEIAPFRVEEVHRRKAAELGERVGVHQVPARVGHRRVGHAPLLQGLQGAAGILVLEVDAQHRHLVAVVVVEGLQRRHLLLARTTPGEPQADDHRPLQRGQVDAGAAAQARQRDVGERAATGAGHAVLHACRRLERAEVGGVDLDLARAGPRNDRALVVGVARGQRHHQRSGNQRGEDAHQLRPSVRSSLAAVSGSVGPAPYDGHHRATGQAPQAGFWAWQHRRPCQIR